MASYWAGLLFGTSIAQAAVFLPATSFYRTPQSLFPSGQAARLELEKTQTSERIENFYQVSKDGREFRLPAGLVLRDLDLSAKAIEIATGETGLILRSSPPWYEILKEKGGKSWKLGRELAPVPDDLGLAVVFSAHSLRKEPQWKSEALSFAQVGSRFLIVGYQDQFVKVATFEKPSQIGFLELGSVLMKVDVASFVAGGDGRWKPFRHRDGGLAVFADGSKMGLSGLRGVMTRPELGVLNTSVAAERLVARSTVEVKSQEWIRWAGSTVKDHGSVFWKKQEQSQKARADLESLSTEEILKRPLSSVGVHPQNPLMALVAAGGVFLTRDGQAWSQLSQFPTTGPMSNLPVAIGKRGELFVGGFRSVDAGKTFHPYLRWEDLTSLLENRFAKAPGDIKISEINSISDDKVVIAIESGTRKVSLQGNTRFGLVTEWTFLP